jgi:hypothetical protein
MAKERGELRKSKIHFYVALFAFIGDIQFNDDGTLKSFRKEF